MKRLMFMGLLAASFALAQQPASQPAPPVEQSQTVPATAETPKVQASAQQTPATAPALENSAGVSASDGKGTTVSVFVKSPEEIRALQDELRNLQTMAGDSNPEVAALLKKAHRIAEMNDRCSSISLNELLDTACARFYEVELPTFENEYMELTGEVRLGTMRMATTFDERIRQLASCSDALTSIVKSREQLLRLRGNVYLEPINYEGDFDAEYDFKLSYDSSRVNQQQRLANLWIQKCGGIVLRQSGREFAPMFVATLKVKNDSLKKVGSNVKFVMNKKTLSLRVDMRRPVSGAYYLNGVRLFEKTVAADKSQSNLFFDIKNMKANIVQPKDGVIQTFSGTQVFKKLKKMEMVGRWAWDAEKLPDEAVQANSQDESEKMTAEDSLAYKQGLAELERALSDEQESEADPAKQTSASNAAASAKKDSVEGRFRVHWIPLAIAGAVAVGGGVMAAVFNSKAKSERDKEPINPDEYNEHLDKIESAQTMRNVGIGLAIGGAVGAAVTFLF
jgi:hypothetical protein